MLDHTDNYSERRAERHEGSDLHNNCELDSGLGLALHLSNETFSRSATFSVRASQISDGSLEERP